MTTPSWVYNANGSWPGPQFRYIPGIAHAVDPESQSKARIVAHTVVSRSQLTKLELWIQKRDVETHHTVVADNDITNETSPVWLSLDDMKNALASNKDLTESMRATLLERALPNLVDHYMQRATYNHEVLSVYNSSVEGILCSTDATQIRSAGTKPLHFLVTCLDAMFQHEHENIIAVQWAEHSGRVLVLRTDPDKSKSSVTYFDASKTANDSYPIEYIVDHRDLTRCFDTLASGLREKNDECSETGEDWSAFVEGPLTEGFREALKGLENMAAGSDGN